MPVNDYVRTRMESGGAQLRAKGPITLARAEFARQRRSGGQGWEEGRSRNNSYADGGEAEPTEEFADHWEFLPFALRALSSGSSPRRDEWCVSRWESNHKGGWRAFAIDCIVFGASS